MYNPRIFIFLKILRKSHIKLSAPKKILFVYKYYNTSVKSVATV